MRMNVIPAQHKHKDTTTCTTPLELYHGEKPDARTLFPFGCFGTFYRENDGTHHRTKFESKACSGIAVGRDRNSNSLIFWCPEVSHFNTSADYTLDENKDLKDAYPELVCDGGLEVRPLHSNSTLPIAYSVGMTVTFRAPGSSTDEIASGVVIAIPIARRQEFYVIQLADETTINLDPTELIDPASAVGGNQNLDPTQGDPLQHATVTKPPWMTQDARVILEHDGQRHRGYMSQDGLGEWVFEQHNLQGIVTETIRQSELGGSWHTLDDEGLIDIDWDNSLGHGRHVSAKGLRKPCPGFLWKAMSDPSSVDYETWLAAYKEEHDALKRLGTYVVIDKAAVDKLGVTPIPTMNILNVKPDAKGNPLRAKSRAVVLGNEEERCWEKTDVYAPVIGKTSARAFVANGVALGRITKQADAKNAFCHPSLPDDEVCVVTPPKGCPFSKPGDYWLLKKTLYGLRRSPQHWYKTLASALADIGLTPCAHDPCIYTGKSPTGSTTCVGIYVDDVIYYGTDDEAESWFESELRKHIMVDFMGAFPGTLVCTTNGAARPTTALLFTYLKRPTSTNYSKRNSCLTAFLQQHPTELELQSIASHTMVHYQPRNQL